MNKNVGGIDRTARLVVGPLLVLLGIAGYAGLVWLAVGPLPQALTSVIVFLIGAILLVTGLVQRCPANSLLGLNTYGREESEESVELGMSIDLLPRLKTRESRHGISGRTRP